MRLIKTFLVFLILSVALRAMQAQTTRNPIPTYPERERSFDVLHIKIDVKIDDKNKVVLGTVESKIRPLGENFSVIELDAEDMQFHEAKVNGNSVRIDQSGFKVVKLIMDKNYSPSDILTYQIIYTARPVKGMYFVAKDSLDPNAPRQVWTQGEAADNHHWFPCYDAPNDKSTSEVIMTVSDEYTTLSNGRLLKVSENKKAQTKTWRWLQDKPHSSYLIMLVAGDYVRIEDMYKKKKVDFYAYQSNIEDARNSLNNTVKAITFFSDKIGFEYPWDKYSQIILRNFMYGGMENTSATTLTETTIHDRRSEIDGITSNDLMAHELAHQWWGDVVTARSWSHIWLNEGFASYFERLFEEHLHGRAAYEGGIIVDQNAVRTNSMYEGRAMVFPPAVDVNDWPITNVYQKGSCVLAMIRWLVGDALWWKTMNTYIHRYAFNNVTTEDFRTTLEEVTGMNFENFFREWVYGTGIPHYKVSSSWNDVQKYVTIRILQPKDILDRTDSLRPNMFSTPIEIALHTSIGVTRYRVNPRSTDESVDLPCNEKPILIEFDPSGALLKEITFPKTSQEWIVQAEHGSGVESRMIALDSLKKMEPTKEIFACLRLIATGEAYFDLRRRAVTMLHRYHEFLDESDYTLLLREENARVRVECIRLTGQSREKKFFSNIENILLHDSSYACIDAALKLVIKWDSARATSIVRKMFQREEQPNTILISLISAVQALRSRVLLPYVLNYVSPSTHYDVRLAAVQIISKYGKDVDGVIDKMIFSLRDRSVPIRSAAARALGDFGNSDALSALETQLQTESNQLVKRSLERAIEKLKKKS